MQFRALPLSSQKHPSLAFSREARLVCWRLCPHVAFQTWKMGRFPSPAAGAPECGKRHDVAMAAMAVPFTAWALHLCEAGGSYLNSKHK